MKPEIASILAVICCALFVTARAQFTCAEHALWNIPEFTCRSGNECVLKRFECDSILDCQDFSDEDHCEDQHAANCIKDFEGKKLRSGEPLQSFQCTDGMCILGCQRCDGTVHCRDFSDELGCTGNEERPPCK